MLKVEHLTIKVKPKQVRKEILKHLVKLRQQKEGSLIVQDQQDRKGKVRLKQEITLTQELIKQEEDGSVDMKGVNHYKKNGSLHKGGMHKMPDGSLHSGKTHGKNTQKLFHFKELNKKAKTKAKTYWGK